MLIDIMAGEDAASAFDFLSDVEPAAEKEDASQVEESDGVDDTDDIREDDSAPDPDVESEEAEPESSAQPDLDDIVEQLRQRDDVIAAQAAQLGHLVRRLNAPQGKPYEQLDPNDPKDAAHIAECEAEAAEFNIDPAYVHRDKVKNFWREEAEASARCIQSVGEYVDSHPDANELGDALARRVSTDRAWQAQLKIASSLPASEMAMAAKAAIDGMYAQLKLEHVQKRSKAEVAAARLAAQRQAENDERAKRRGRGERAGVTPGSASPRTSASRDDDSFDAVVDYAQGGFWSAFK